MWKVLPLVLITLLCSSAVQFLMATPAHACSPGPAYMLDVIDDDTPECLSHHIGSDEEGIRLRLVNDCAQEIEFQATECDHCDTNALVAAGDEATIMLDHRSLVVMEDGQQIRNPELEDGEVSEQHYEWTLDDDEGVLQTQITHQDNSDHCAGCHCSSSDPSSSAGSMLLVLLLLAVVAVGRRKPHPITETTQHTKTSPAQKLHDLERLS